MLVRGDGPSNLPPFWITIDADRSSHLPAGPLPRFDGVVIDVPPAPREAGTTSPPPAAGAPIRVPPLNPDDVNKFVSLFDKSDVARTGVLSGKSTFPERNGTGRRVWY